jgi:hypothetical protein
MLVALDTKTLSRYIPPTPSRVAMATLTPTVHLFRLNNSLSLSLSLSISIGI